MSMGFVETIAEVWYGWRLKRWYCTAGAPKGMEIRLALRWWGDMRRLRKNACISTRQGRRALWNRAAKINERYRRMAA